MPRLLAPTPQTNLLRNADFQAGLAAWEPASGAAALSLDPAGLVSVTVDNVRPVRAALSQAVPVEPGASYYVAYRVRTEGLVGCAGLTLTFRDRAGQPLAEMGILPLSGDHDWTARAWRCRAPEGAAEALVSVGVEGASAGRAAFDDLCFAPDDAPLTRALIVDWREEGGPLPGLEGYSVGDAAELAAALARGVAGLSACPAAAVPGGTDSPLAPGPATALLAQWAQTPLRLSTQGSDALGFAVLAGRSEDGRLAQIMIADAGSRSEGYRLSLAGFPAGFCYTVAQVASEGQARLVREGDGAALNGLLMSPWRSPAVQLVRIWWP